jgi:hypothetical protein
MATRRNIAYSPPAGTVLFLQIFYLDNMDYGQISLPKGAEPRIELYDARTLSKHIPADTIGLRGQTPCRMFGNVKVLIDPLYLFLVEAVAHTSPRSWYGAG